MFTDFRCNIMKRIFYRVYSPLYVQIKSITCYINHQNVLVVKDKSGHCNKGKLIFSTPVELNISLVIWLGLPVLIPVVIDRLNISSQGSIFLFVILYNAKSGNPWRTYQQVLYSFMFSFVLSTLGEKALIKTVKQIKRLKAPELTNDMCVN